MINNGIINIGDNNTNNITYNIDYELVEKEIKELLKYHQDKNLKEALTYSQNKDRKNLLDCLRKLSKETLEIIKHLSLITLEKIIENNLF